MSETIFSDMSLTVPEAAFVTGHSVRSVNHEIDGRIIQPHEGPGGRTVRHADLLYLGAIRNLRTQLGPTLRKRLLRAIRDAADARLRTAHIEHFSVALDAVENDLNRNIRLLERLRSEQIESRPDVLSGEPVLKGTRMPVWHVANMLRQGTTVDEIVDAFDLTPEQVAAAEMFDRVSPRQGRPRRATSGRRVPADR